MSYFYEFEPYLDGFLEYGVGAGLLSNSVSYLLALATYVLTSLALYTMAQRRGIKNAWLSWIPMINCWIVGSLSDQYRYVVKGEIKNKRKSLLILNIIKAVAGVAVFVIAIALIVVSARSFVHSWTEWMTGVMGLLIALGALCLLIFGIGIATMVIRYMALYDIYTSCNPQNNVVYLVLSIIFRITEPLFLFLSREQDGGLPPRRTAPVYETFDEQTY